MLEDRTDLGLGTSTARGNVERRIIATERWVEKLIDGTFVWTLDKIGERRTKGEVVKSGYFHARMQPYKLALSLSTNGFGDRFHMKLCVHCDDRNSSLIWPLQADVTIKITNKARPDVYRIETKHCTIEKPVNNSGKMSEAFEFIYADLSIASLSSSHSLIAECVVNIR